MTPAFDSPAVLGDDTRVLVTAEEAYPAFEALVLDARHEIHAGFRIFDLTTRLRSDRARAVGRDWFDLLLHKLRKGVAIRMVLSDFDPVVGTSLHATTWRSMRAFAALRELAPPGASVEVSASMHPARLAVAVRLALWPRVQKMLGAKAREVMALPPPQRAAYLSLRPGLTGMIAREERHIRPRRLHLPDLKPVTHHQKVAVIDRAVVYCGGLDLNERRYDGWDHDRPGDETWHDVQLIRRDRATAEAARAHLETFVATTHRRADPPPGGGLILRTLSMRARGNRRLMSPRDRLHEIEDAVIEGVGRAERLIYLETQFLRDRRVTRALVRAAERQPGLQLFVVLPGAPEDVAFLGNNQVDARFGEFLQARCVTRLRRAFGMRLFLGAPVQPRPSRSRGRDSLHGAPIIYVHSKVCLFDDAYGIVSSANLNGRSMRWDTEFGVPLHGSRLIADTRRRLLAHWLGDPDPGETPLLDAETCVPAWRALAARNVASAPAQRRGFLVPFTVGPARRFGLDLRVVPEEMV
jgi:phospholipase D1/2